MPAAVPLVNKNKKVGEIYAAELCTIGEVRLHFDDEKCLPIMHFEA